MEDKPRYAIIEQYIAHERWGAATQFLAQALPTAPPADKPYIASQLEICVAHDVIASLTLATMLSTGDGIAGDQDRAIRIIENALARGVDYELAIAHAFFGQIYLEITGSTPDMRRAFFHLEKAALGGHAVAAFNAGIIAQNGFEDVRPDPARAAEHYRRAARLGIKEAMTNLGAMIATDAIPVELSEARALLEEAARLGEPMAPLALQMFVFGDEVCDLDDEEPEMSPIILASTRRPILVARELHEAFHLSLADVQFTAAMLCGCDSWDELVEWTELSDTPDPPDEGVDPETLAERLEWQTSIVSAILEISRDAAGSAIELLRPTAGAGKPSLDGLSERLAASAGRISRPIRWMPP